MEVYSRCTSKIRPRDQSPLTRITQGCMYHFFTFLQIYFQYFQSLLLVEILLANGNIEKIDRFESETHRKCSAYEFRPLNVQGKLNGEINT